MSSQERLKDRLFGPPPLGNRRNNNSLNGPFHWTPPRRLGLNSSLRPCLIGVPSLRPSARQLNWLGIPMTPPGKTKGVLKLSFFHFFSYLFPHRSSLGPFFQTPQGFGSTQLDGTFPWHPYFPRAKYHNEILMAVSKFFPPGTMISSKAGITIPLPKSKGPQEHKENTLQFSTDC